MHEEAISDIGAALIRLRDACKKHHVPVPDTLSWSDQTAGDKARLIIKSIPYRNGTMLYRIGPRDGRDDQIAGFFLKYGRQ